MPVPRRKNLSSSAGILTSIQKGLTISSLIKLIDINYVFQKCKFLLLWGFTPTVIYVGLSTEPKPSFIDIFNIFE